MSYVLTFLVERLARISRGVKVWIWSRYTKPAPDGQTGAFFEALVLDTKRIRENGLCTTRTQNAQWTGIQQNALEMGRLFRGNLKTSCEKFEVGDIFVPFLCNSKS